MGLVGAFCLLTSGAVDFVFAARAKTPDDAPVSPWAPEALAAGAVAFLALHPAKTGGAGRRRDCHFAGAPSPCLLTHLYYREGGGSAE